MGRLLKYAVPAAIASGAMIYGLWPANKSKPDVTPIVKISVVDTRPNTKRQVIRPDRSVSYSESKSPDSEHPASHSTGYLETVKSLEQFFNDCSGLSFIYTNYHQFDSILNLIPQVRESGLVSFLEKSDDHKIARYNCGNFEIEEEERRFDSSTGKTRDNPDYTLVISRGRDLDAPSFVYTFIASSKYTDSFHGFNAEHNVVPDKNSSYFRVVGERLSSSDIRLNSLGFTDVDNAEIPFEAPHYSGFCDSRFMREFRELNKSFAAFVDSRKK